MGDDREERDIVDIHEGEGGDMMKEEKDIG